MWVQSLGQEDPWRRTRQPTPVFLPGEPCGQKKSGDLEYIGMQRARQDWTYKQGHGYVSTKSSICEYTSDSLQSAIDG